MHCAMISFGLVQADFQAASGHCSTANVSYSISINLTIDLKLSLSIPYFIAKPNEARALDLT